MSKIKKILLVAALGLIYPFMAFSMDSTADLYDINAEIAMSDEMMKTFRDYDNYLDASVKALEECDQADDSNINSYFAPCSRAWHIIGKPTNIALGHKIKNFVRQRTFRGFIEQHGEEQAKDMLENKVGVKIIEKMKKEHNLSVRYGEFNEKLTRTQEKMGHDTDTSKFNAYLPRILGDLCARNNNPWGIAQECKELQGFFHRKEADSRDEYSPFSLPKDKNFKWNIRALSPYLKLSAQTTAGLIQLTQQGYEGDGKCEEGPALDYGQEMDNDRQINAQFPDMLKRHCNIYPGLNACAILREMVYDAQNPSKRIHDDVNRYDFQVARGFINDLFHNDQRLIKRINKKTGGDLCSKMDSFGCRSEDEVRQCAKDFKKSSLHNKNMSANVHNVIDNFKSLEDFRYHITQDGLIVIETAYLSSRFTEERTFDCSSDLKKVLAQEYGVDKDTIEKNYSHWSYIVSQPVGSGYRGIVCGFFKDDVDREKTKELGVLLKKTHQKIQKMASKKK